jgi:methyl-accepting chemotaxis protein
MKETSMANLMGKRWMIRAGAFALVLAAGAAVVTVESRAAQVGGHAWQGLAAAGELRADLAAPNASVMEAYLLALELAGSGDDSARAARLARLRELRDVFDERHAYWKATLPAGALRDTVLGATYQPARDFYAVLEGSFVPALQAGDRARVSEALGVLAQRYATHRAALDRALELSASAEHASSAAAALAAARAEWLLFGLVLATIGLAVGAAFVLGRRLSRPVGDATLALAGLGRGELGVRLVVGSDDELGRMAEAFNGASESLEGTARGMQRQASRLVAETESLAQVSRAMGTSVSEGATRADSMAHNAAHVSRSVQSLAGAVDQLQQCIGEISRSATQAAQVAGSAVSVAEHAQATVTRLEQSSDEIGGITKLITHIAEQTNLLALNATIEAARAGDAGKGFAVVAGEVKELARATAGATENIGTKVDAIRRDIRDATLAIVKIGATIQEIASYQTTIASAVEEQTATTKDIGGTLSDAAVGAQQIAASIDSVAEASRATARGVQSTGIAAQALARMAAELESQVAHFRGAGEAKATVVAAGGDGKNGAAKLANGHSNAHSNGRSNGLSNGLSNGAGGSRNGRHDHLS